MKEWLTLAEAAVLAGRTKRTIYNWIELGHIKARRNPDGEYRVRSEEVGTAEATVRRGRPKGSGKTR